ncbi:LysR family transcriptional regulator [Actinomadura rubrisoli]|uniref:LysR family transcriptional regulator n=1 Tax=Actinomadura rubrisoli TaxID=2530368 RepID=A0A4R5BTJ8_9ACTN|nr:LysR family transcriptional regulator [Actinomadura rubrisoli]TDD90401.1 LysR family transcriptional regulator [Actinomadura rubrisoli]
MADNPVPSTARAIDADLDLRLVRYFTVVAEHLNFGRAADALHLAQPSLSRQIQRLEHQLGVRLLDRTPQGSRLTGAGAAFLPQAQALLHAAQQATLTARAAAPPRTITIGYVDDLVITPAVRDLRRRHPAAQVRTRHLNWDETGALSDGRVDALIARAPLPSSTERLQVTVLYDEPRVLVVPASHRLAGKESVTPDDIADEALVPCTGTGTGAGWSEFWRLEPRPGGHPAPLGPIVVDTFEDKLELIADGRALAVLPAGDRRITLRDDLAALPLDGIDPCQVVVATRANDRNPLVADFRDTARTHFTGPL